METNVLLVFAVFCGTVNFVKGADWQYGPNGDDSSWSGLCESGEYQSPINLSPLDSAVGELGDLHFNGYDKQTDGTIQNNGHSLELKLTNKNITMKGGGLKGKYVLEQMHFHWKSEHTIMEKRYGAECHFVHRNLNYKNLSEAVRHKDGIAVLGVLFHVSNEDNPIFDLMLKNDKLVSTPGTKVDIDSPMRPSEFLPAEKHEFYRYHGSLTTPNCAESVTWTVFTHTLHISEDQVNKFQTVQSGHGPLKENFRQLKVLNSRLVVYQERHHRNPGNKFESSLFVIMNFILLILFRSYSQM